MTSEVSNNMNDKWKEIIEIMNLPKFFLPCLFFFYVIMLILLIFFWNDNIYGIIGGLIAGGIIAPIIWFYQLKKKE
jgi:hypothetical protein